MKAYKVHKSLSALMEEAYNREDGTVFFCLFDGRSVTITDYGNEFRVSTGDSKNPEAWVTASELRSIMHADEESEYDRPE